MIGFRPPAEVHCNGGSDGRKAVTTEKHPNGAETKTERYDHSTRTVLESLAETLGVSGIIAIFVIGTMCATILIQCIGGHQIELPKYLTEFSMLIIGYYFGQKTQRSAKEEKAKIGFSTE